MAAVSGWAGSFSSLLREMNLPLLPTGYTDFCFSQWGGLDLPGKGQVAQLWYPMRFGPAPVTS